jgi:hypothetical protein
MGRKNISIKKALFPPFSTTQMVMRRAKDVRIADPDVILKRAEELADRWKLFRRRFDGVRDSEDPAFILHDIGSSEEERVQWLFLIDTLNYSFWPNPGEPAWTVEYGGRKWSGYWGLAASLKRAYEEGFPLTDASFISKISEDDLRYIFRGEGIIPLFQSRVAHLREIGRVLLEQWDGDVVTMIYSAGQSAERLVNLIVTYFPSFRDEVIYGDEKIRVFFWKRAQLYVADIYTMFSGQGLGEFHDIDVLTAFADYKLPQVLRALGILEYSKELANQVDNRIPLQPGDQKEIEIRAATVQAVELLSEAMETITGDPVFAVQMDQFIWYLGQDDAFRKNPYHLCRTVFY